jgi:hypothetical protein
MSHEEFAATYMTDGDFLRIQRENEETLQIMKRGEYPGTTHIYFRGLEMLLPQQRRERRQHIDFAVYTVMRTQYDCRGVLTPRWIRNYYCTLTAPAVAVAYTMGVWDAEAMQAEIQADEAKGARRKKQAWI